MILDLSIVAMWDFGVYKDFDFLLFADNEAIVYFKVDSAICFLLFLFLLKIFEKLLWFVALSIEVEGQVVHRFVLALPLLDAEIYHKSLGLVHCFNFFTRNVHKSWHQLRNILLF